MDMPLNVPVDDPNADTEWFAPLICVFAHHANPQCPRNDILRKHGVIPEKPPSPTPFIEEAILEARRLAHENRLEGKDLDELDELEDEEDEEFLARYRYAQLSYKHPTRVVRYPSLISFSQTNATSPALKYLAKVHPWSCLPSSKT